MKKAFIIFTFLLLSFTFLKGQNTKVFETPNFQIEYPEFLMTSNDEGIINIYPTGEIGAITISGYKDLDLSQAEVKNLILTITGSQENPESIKVKKSGNKIEYYYDYNDTERDGIWTTKTIQKNDVLYVVSIFCKTNLWNGNIKNQFIDSFKSFKLK